MKLPKNSQIDVAVTIDRNYAQAAGVMLNSLFMNTKSAVCVYVLHPDLTDADIAKINEVTSQYDHGCIEYIQMGDAEFSNLTVDGHLSSVMYYKLRLASALPSHVGKAVYLDPDILVVSDIAELWNIDLGDTLLGGTPVYVRETREKIVEKGAPYFRVGVMLANINQWRETSFEERALKLAIDLAGYYKTAPEQDILNVSAAGNWTPLPVYWNKCPSCYQANHIYSKEELRQARRGKGIIHFPGPVKPWHYACSHPQRGLYLKYRKGTPWEAEPLEGRNLISFISRMTPESVTFWISRKLAHSALGDLIKKVALRK